MAVNDKQRRYLKGLAHPLKPVVMIGNAGLTENVLAEIENALAYHELIKVRVSGQEKADRKQMLDEIAKKTGADNDAPPKTHTHTHTEKRMTEESARGATASRGR